MPLYLEVVVGVPLIFRTQPHGREERCVPRGGIKQCRTDCAFSAKWVVAQHLVFSPVVSYFRFCFVLWFGCSGEFDLGS